MSFLAPGFLVAAGLVALGVVALHFLSTRDPRLESFPTARFVPDQPVQARALTMQFADLALLLLRVFLLLLAGAALARPVLTPPRQALARIVAVDVSRAVGDPAQLADSARAYLADASSTIFFDGAARDVRIEPADSLAAYASGAGPAAAARGSLSAAMVAARRAAARLRDRADSMELVIVSPFAAEERDAATARLRGLWPGRITTVSVTAAGPTDSSTVRVEWADSGATALWTARSTPDTVGAVRAGTAVMVYPFARRWQLAARPDSATRVAARWADGEPAAVERTSANGCVRSIAFALPTEGDALLRPDFQRFVASLAAPCGEPHDFAPLPAAFMDTLRGTGPLAPTAAIARPVERVTPLAPWLLGAALLLALVELFARRRVRRTTPASGGERASATGVSRKAA